MTSGGKLIDGLFKGETINTPSMLAVEDALDGLRWAEAIGGLDALIARSESNLTAIESWVAASDWAAFLAADKPFRSCTSVCLKIADAAVAHLDAAARASVPKTIAALLEAEAVAFDIDAYRDAPPGLRIWAGATIERADLGALFPWLDWAFAQAIADKLYQLGQTQQVLCVTHQPLVAALADVHFRVDKTMIEESSLDLTEEISETNLSEIRTVVRVVPLNSVQERQQELAQLTGGHSAEEALTFAQSLLTKARSKKS
jgi:hypothetical protein